MVHGEQEGCILNLSNLVFSKMVNGNKRARYHIFSNLKNCLQTSSFMMCCHMLFCFVTMSHFSFRAFGKFMNSGRGLLALEAGPGIPDPWVSGPEYKRSNQCVRQMCAPKCCAEFSVRRILRRILCRILGAPNFAPNLCAEFCLHKIIVLRGKIAFSEKLGAPKIRHTNSAQNSAHPKFGTHIGTKFGAPKIRRNISAHTFGAHIGWIVCTRGPDPKDLGSLRPGGPGAQAQSS